jgi:hypothetical protein
MSYPIPQCVMNGVFKGVRTESNNGFEKNLLRLEGVVKSYKAKDGNIASKDMVYDLTYSTYAKTLITSIASLGVGDAISVNFTIDGIPTKSGGSFPVFNVVSVSVLAKASTPAASQPSGLPMADLDDDIPF